MENIQISKLILRYPQLKRVETEIENSFCLLQQSFASGGKLLLAGNGGSCADAEHIVGELMKGFTKPRRIPQDFSDALKEIDPDFGEKLAGQLQGTLPAIALTGHPALTTAYANDVNGELSFAQQVNGYGGKGDVFLGISTSGNARNIIFAAITAKAKGMKVIALTGKTGGTLARFADSAIIVPEEETYKIQELHLPIYHTLCLMLEDTFFG